MQVYFIRKLSKIASILKTKSSAKDKSEMRILVVANSYIPTLQLSIIKPLDELINKGICTVTIITEQQMKSKFGKNTRSEKSWAWIQKNYLNKDITHILFCRYSGPHFSKFIKHSKAKNIANMYLIDDDILNVPIELGEKKFKYHNHPLRLKAVNYLLNNCDLIYCSNINLYQRLRKLGIDNDIYTTEIFCGGKILTKATLRPVTTIGYMGFDHTHDFQIALPAIIKIMRKYPHIKFELFGKIPKPLQLDEFGNRVSVLPPIEQYDLFLHDLSLRNWDIGICPLARTDFNLAKNINKWIEYSLSGSCVIASKNMIYDYCCSDNCGTLVDDQDWFEALNHIIEHPDERYRQVSNAQDRLKHDFSIEHQRSQLLTAISQADKNQLNRAQ